MPVITCRTALAGLTSLPLIARPARDADNTQTLRFIPATDLSALDPIWTTAYVVRNHGYMVFDTLFMMDTKFQIHPQMAEGHQADDDGKRWTATSPAASRPTACPAARSSTSPASNGTPSPIPPPPCPPCKPTRWTGWKPRPPTSSPSSQQSRHHRLHARPHRHLTC